MKMEKLLVALVLLLASCAADRDAGRRYQAERDVWRADWEYQRLSIRPQEVTDEQWKELAGQYEAIADRYSRRPDSDRPGTTQQQDVRTVAARSLFTAAQIHALLGDSTGADVIYGRIARDFANVGDVAAEVALVRGRIAERKGEASRAADLYQEVVDRVDPQPDAQGVAGAVLDLPLQIARLRARSAEIAPTVSQYEAARSYYERLVRTHSGDLTQIDSQIHLAQISADLGEWKKGIRALRLLETQLRTFDKPPLDPAAIRIDVAETQDLSGADPESARVTLSSLLNDYPGSPLVPKALFALADNARRRGQVDEALGYLDRIDKEQDKDEGAASEALLARAQLLEKSGRWSEAQTAFKVLRATHPLSDAALSAPLEIAGHYARRGKQDSLETALGQAERAYRDIISKYPSTPPCKVAQDHLVQTLALEQNFDSAVQEMVGLGADPRLTPSGARNLIFAAGIACNQLADTARAVAILDRVGELYAGADVGRWASNQAIRLRGAMAQ